MNRKEPTEVQLLRKLVQLEFRREQQMDEALDLLHAIADALIPLTPGKLKSLSLLFGSNQKQKGEETNAT